MKYIAQYIKKICPEVVVTNSKTTESVYYQMEHNFVVRLSEHIGWYEKGKISIVKSFNTEDFIVMIDTSPFPMVKNREEVKRMIKNLYEFSVYSYKTMITLGLLFIYLFIALITYFIAADVENGILSSLIIIGTVGLGIGVYSLFHYGIIPICAITLLIVGVIDVAVAVFMFVLGK